MFTKKIAACALAAATPIDLPLEFELSEEKCRRGMASLMIPA